MLNDYNMKYILEQIEKNLNNRKLAFYGKNIEMLNYIESMGYKVDRIFTENLNLLNEQKDGFYCPAIEMKNQADHYYLILPFWLPDGGKHQRELCDNYGYKNNLDYVSYYPIKTLVSEKENGIYKDCYGNKVLGLKKNISVFVQGYNNNIEISNNIEIDGKLVISCDGNDNTVLIESNCYFSLENTINMRGDKNRINIGKNTKFINTRGMLLGNTYLKIGEGVSLHTDIFYMHSHTKVDIGNDCMFSFDIIVQTGDGHTIFDVKSKKNMNSNLEWLQDKRKYLSEIRLDDHVWVGRRSFIFSGGHETRIGCGSIIGAQSFVKGKFPNNVIVAGSPARIIKKDIAWSRKNCSNNILDCGDYVNDTYENVEIVSQKEVNYKIKELERRIALLEENNKKKIKLWIPFISRLLKF